MSGKEDVVELENDLTKALSEGGDAALAKALQDLSVTDDGEPDDDDDEGGDTNTGAAADETEDGDKGEGGDGTRKPADDVAAAAATKDDKSGAAAGGQGSQPGKGEEVPAPISNKSGTGTIKYEVLSGARQRAARAEAQLADTQAELQAARDALAKATQAAGGDQQQHDGKQKGNDAAVELTDEEFADMPESVQKLHRYTKALEQKLEKIEATTSKVATQHEETQQSTTQEVIDQVPDLVEWQSKGGSLWRIAVEVDQSLRGDPDWGNKPMKERFEKVAEIVRAEVGLAPRTAAAANTTTGAPDKKAAAKAAAADVPASLSEIPGGGAPLLDVHDSIEKTSASGLAARMGSMKDADIDALLAKVS